MKRLATLAVMKLSLYLDAEENQELFQYYQGLLLSEVTEGDLARCHELPEYLFEDMPVAAQRYGKLYRLLEGNPVAVTAIQLYLLVCMDVRTLQIFEHCFGIHSEGPTIQEAWAITYRKEEVIEQIPDLYRAFVLVKYLLLADMGEQNFLKAAFRPDPYLAAWISGENDIDYGLRNFCEVWLAKELLGEQIILREEKGQAVAFLERQGRESVIYVGGPWGSGKKFFVRQAAGGAGYSVLSVPYEKLVVEGHIAETVWTRALRECLLRGLALCITDITECKGGLPCIEAAFQKMKQEYSYLNMPLFLTGSKEVKTAILLKRPVFTVSITDYTLEEQEAFWKYFSQAYLEDSIYFPAEALASRINLTAGQIECVMEQLVGLGHGKTRDMQDIFRICYQILDDGRYQNMNIITGGYTWEDLKLPPYPEKLLMELCSQAECQMTVLNHWGMGKKVSYGRCISALFSGPPGTGKTMAAQVVASHLGLDIYRIDLSQIMDKYIGETEKRLKEVFDQAEKSSMILLFDEADALFASRTDAGDARDKYNNIQVSYLLQRMEEYTGIVLMATNLAANVDPAFYRRFRYHIQFQLPGESLRRELWEYMLDGIPHEEIDFGYLASQFELSGAQIKNIALNACYRAAAEEKKLQMGHLVEGIFQEGRKEGKLMLAEDFGAYGKFLDGLFQLMNQNID